MQDNTSIKPILSISLLSSGRKETIWKCLDSLQPIRDALSTELIIVDTGCDEETHNKMKEYTDRIIKFTWCNDFSKARNVGLKEAIGEWFLFIDDDEWFTDVTELIEFFQSGEYKEYGCANYIQRNYTNISGKIYKDAWVSRMIRLDKDTRFMSSIHEYLYPIKGKCKLLHCPADHYGYIFKDNREKYAHSKRNITLLIDMIEKERTQTRWWIQLAQEYMGIQEYHKLEEMCNEAIEEFKKINNNYVNRNRGTFYVGLISVEMKRGDYEKAKEDYLTFIEDKRNTDLCRAKLYSLGAEIYYNLENYSECEDLCKKYLKIYHKLRDNEYEIMSQSSFFIDQVFEEGNRNNVYGFYIKASLSRGDSSILKEYFYYINWEANELRIYTSTPTDIVEGIAVLPFEEEFVDIVEKMLQRRGVEPKIIKHIREIEEKEEEEAQAKFQNLCKIFAKTNSQNHYVLYLKIRQASFTGEMEGIEEVYGKLLGRVINLWELEDSVFTIATKYNLDLEPVLLKIKFENWKKGVDMLFKKPEKEKIDIRIEFLHQIRKSANLRYDYFFMKESEARLRMLKEEEEYDKIYVFLKEYCRQYLGFYQRFYKEEAFQGEMEMLIPECRLAVKLSKVFEEEEQGNIRQMTEALKECFGIYPSLDKILQKFTEGKKEELKEAGEMRKEMLQLGEKIKTQLYALIAQGMYIEAFGILQQLKSLLPEEPEVLALETTIKEGMS